MRATPIWISTLVLVILATSQFYCATAVQSDLEEARFELDKKNYTVAITQAEAVLAVDPNNIEAARVAASAYFARGGFDFLDLAEEATALETADDNYFKLLANTLPAENTVTLSDLRAAITTMEAVTGIDASSFTDEAMADAVFDLSLMQVIEHFALGVYQSNFKSGTFDPSAITSDAATAVQADLVNFDNRMVASGVDAGESFLSALRMTFCILEPISAGSGFTQGEYQALVGCQFNDNAAAFDTTVFTANIANCLAVIPTTQSQAVKDCYNANTAL